MQPAPIDLLLRKYASGFHPVVPYVQGSDKFLPLDLSAGNKELTAAVYGDINLFSNYIKQLLTGSGCKYAIGGYAEQRIIYAASEHFDDAAEPRRFHLGVDIWGDAGTPVYAFMGGIVHSVAFNNHKGDYGATMVLLHQLEGTAFYTLYGHISLRDIEQLSEGQYVVRGQEIAHFGTPAENGQWPPHLHLQVIVDMELKKGDYPGVCKYSEREKYLKNCPDPNLILSTQYLVLSI